MQKKHFRQQKLSHKDGFSITEVIITSTIIGILASIAYPNYIAGIERAEYSEVKTTMLTIPPIISAYIDGKGETPETWEDLSTITAVMTNNGPATGNLSSPITLPSSIYGLLIEGPAESVYTLTATRVVDRDKEEPNEEEYQFAIKSCFNISNGASDLRSGNLTDIESELNCG